MALTGRKGILEYQDSKGYTTTVVWETENAETFIEREFCGTGAPLAIKWAGDRYSTTAPSSATINLLIKTLEDRQFLEDLFNGGYIVTVYKEDHVTHLPEPFWKGKVTPDLTIEQYKQYPYTLALNCNDGIKMSEDKQFLMADFPEPGIVPYLEVLITYINNHLYPRNSFKLNVANRIFSDEYALEDTLENLYIDPRVFMNDDDDLYIDFKDVANSLFGPLHLQLVQWKGEWWLLALDAQWDAGKVSYTTYSVLKGTVTKLSSTVDDLGILDLYLPGKGVTDVDREVEANAGIVFIPSWNSTELEQDFQLNKCILPVFANRGGNFYHGHFYNNYNEFRALEFNQMQCYPCTGNLRHWFNGGLPVYQLEENAGLAKTAVVGETNNLYYIQAEADVDPNIKFDTFYFKLNADRIGDWSPLGGDVEYKPVKSVEIKYTAANGDEFWFWRNQGVGDFDGWTNEFRTYIFDTESVDIEALMPDSYPNNEVYWGGTFDVKIYAGAHDQWSGFDIVYSGLQIGPTSSTFKRATFFGITRDYGTIFEIGKDTIVVGINPKGTVFTKEQYRLGLDYSSFRSSHDYHLSSFYDSTRDLYGDDIGRFRKIGTTTNDSDKYRFLMNWKGQVLINENSTYTAQLGGSYKSDLISPLQLINDFEGRVYKFTLGTWNDKTGFWSATFTEAKFVKNIGGPIKGDFSTYDYNDDFFTLTPP